MHFDINKQQFNTDMFSHISLLLSQWTIYGSKGNSGYHCLVNSILKRILVNKDWSSRSWKSNNSKPKIYYILKDLPH